MRGVGLIVLLIAMIIVAMLTVKSIRRNAEAAAKTEGLAVPANLTELPGNVRDKLDKTTKDAQERTKKAMEGIE
jgi:hypothetical protein